MYTSPYACDGLYALHKDFFVAPYSRTFWIDAPALTFKDVGGRRFYVWSFFAAPYLQAATVTPAHKYLRAADQGRSWRRDKMSKQRNKKQRLSRPTRDISSDTLASFCFFYSSRLKLAPAPHSNNKISLS